MDGGFGGEDDDALVMALASFAGDAEPSGSSSDVSDESGASVGTAAAHPPFAFRSDVLYEEDLQALPNLGVGQRRPQRGGAKDDGERAALRRARHKAVVARARLRHKLNAQAMRSLEAELASKLHRLLLQHETRHSSALVDSEAGLQRLRGAYADQVAVEERIRRENAALQRQIEAHDKLQAAAAQLADEYDDMDDSNGSGAAASSASGPNCATTTSGQAGTWLFFDDRDVAPLYYVPLTQGDCRELVRLVYERMLRLYAAFAQRRIPVAELSCFGWTVRRPAEVDARVLRFQFTKRVRRLGDSMDGIVNRTWEAFHDPARFAAIYSTKVITRVVQRVDADTTVLLQNSPVATGDVNIRYFNILARMAGRNERGERVVALVKTIVNPGEGNEGGERLRDVEWMKRGISYLLLTEEESEQQQQQQEADGQEQARVIQLHYGCDFECVSDAHARYLMVEVLGIACRWEQMILQTRHLTL